ncbi:helix-turn-helix transcriptional regulator [Allokutzneria sp. A3M-2-11 16]|uniref:helix-turn-helix domain-containing protein n=1 Tax=Allokutzneria sp. A3M-2-11 16 TaxID=2962043 RepID=UPI0020B8F79F|nr:helix-turn-helix domain-containing protein [Allokutzneria sp. A3M-2-11 16]MCP3800691.1 helix-turn-helix transcriptional regulator [Allokutzneria sp. A3M-2-11 16]
MAISDLQLFSRRLDALCEERRSSDEAYSNLALAKAIGCTRSYITELRNGNRLPTYKTVLALGEQLNAHPAYFVGGRRDREPGSLPTRTVADKVDTLFRLVHPAHKPEMPTETIVARVRDHGRELADPLWTISTNTVNDIRSGRSANPTLRHLIALGVAFGSQPIYFFDDEFARRLEAQLGRHHALALLNVDGFRFRAADLPSSVHDEILLSLASALNPSAEVEAAIRAALRDGRDLSELDHGDSSRT